MRSSPDWNAQVEKVMCNVEHVVYLSYCLMSATTNAERLRLVGAFILFRSNTSVAMRAKKFLLEECPDIFSNKYTAQAQDMRDILDSWDRANESSLALKLRAVASYCMAFSVLEHCGFTPQFAEIIYAEFRVKKETKKVTTFVYAILDVIEFVLSRARICWETGTLKPLFHSSNTYLDWYAKVDEVRLLSRMRGAPDDIEGLRDQDYYLLLEDCITKGEAMAPFTKTIAERKAMNAVIGELKILRHNSAIEQSVSKPREEPLGILVPGDPGIGKSSVTHILGKHYATVRGIKFTSECRFDRNPFDDFMSGFKSSMWFIVMDDVACLEPNKCPSGDKSLADVIQLINMAPYTSNQAELEKKGKVPVLAKLVVANTNVLNMNVFHYFSHPSAVQRRFKFVLTPFVKQEFSKKDGDNYINMLDGEKASAWFEQKRKEMGPDTDPIPDYWDFELLEWLPVPIGGPKRLATNHYPFGLDKNGKPKRIGMHMFLNYYTDKIETHIKNQARMLANMAAMRSVKCCGVCGRSLQFCIDRENHKVFDGIPCKDCKKEDCLHKHQCRRCPCMGITARCHKCNENCEHDIHKSFCNLCRHSIQSETVLECLCNKPDCLWILYPEAIGAVCEDCSYCMSEEDVMEGSCTVCLVKEQVYAQYQVQAGDISLMTWFTLYLCAFMLQIKKLNLNPLRIQEQQQQMQALVVHGQGIVNAYTACNNYVESFYTQSARLRQCIANMGTRVAETLSSRPAMVILGVVVSLVGVGKSCINMHEKFAEQSKECEPRPVDEKKDPWKMDNYVLTPVDVGRKTSNFQSWNREDMIKYIANNIFIVDITTISTKRTRALAVCDRYYIINTHALQGQDNCSLNIRRQLGDSVSDTVLNIKIASSQIFPLSNEITIVFIPELPNRKDIRDLFAKETYNGSSHGYYLYRSDDGVLHEHDVKRIKGRFFRHPMLCDGQAFRVYEGTAEKVTVDGYCGSPLIAETALGPAILGVHSAGNNNRSVITSAIYNELVHKFFKNRMVIDVNDVILDAEGINYSIQGLHDKSCFRYLESGSVQVYGSLDAPRSTPKSSVKKTIIADYLQEHEGYELTHGAPILKGYLPIHHAVVPMIDKEFLLPYTLVKESIDDYFDTVESQLRTDEYQILQRLDMNTVINGADGIRGIDRINMNTSAGFPWRKCKKLMFTGDSEKWEMNEELQNLVKKSTINYKLGRRNNFVFTGSLKDEPKEFAKIESGKTRVFTGQNVVHLLIGRQYYLSFIRLMQRNNLVFENAVGCNAHSDDWDKIVHYLIDFAGNLFDGDYKFYDKSMMAMVIMAIFDGIIAFHRRHSSMDEEDFIVMRGVAYDIAYAYVDFFGDLVSFLRNNPSGHLLTVIINSICGSTYLRIGYHMSTGNPIANYRYHVKAITYGDDVIVSVHDSIKHQFNYESYRDAMAKFNIIFTPASKTNETYKFKPLSEIDFLKRSFIYSDELNRYISPLADKSIKKSLMVCLRSKTITAEEQIIATLSSAHREAWQHGRDYFEEFSAMIRRVVSAHKLDGYVVFSTFLSYNNLRDYYDGKNVICVSQPKLIESEGYQIQSSWVSTRNKSDYPPLDSYCIPNNSTIRNENGSRGYIYQGVPRNLFLEKIRLMVIGANLCIIMIVHDTGHISIAQEYNTKTKENIDVKVIEKENNDIHNQILTGITGTGAQMNQDHQDYNNKGTNTPVDMELSNFLRRPFIIYSGNWTSSSNIFLDIDALSLWLSNTAVGNKLNNYGFIRGKLCVRVVIDSTPFNYGLLHISMLAGAHPISLTSTNAAKYTSYLSQRPSIYMNPSCDRSADLSSVLLHQGEWYSLNGNGSHIYDEYGVNLTINTIVPLLSANGTATPVSYRIYAWMENVELTGATYMVQSEDVEVHSVHDVAKLGTYQTIQLDNYDLQPDTHLPCDSLLMKEYLNVNPFIFNKYWADTDAAGARLFSIEPCPGVCGTSATVAYATPLSFLDRYFMHWRGSLIFTFKIVASKYHSGSLRITWDPLVTNTGESNVQMTKVVSISEETEFEFIVPHNNRVYAFPTDDGLSFPQNHIYDASGTPSVVTKNGALTMRVMNVLNGPTSGATVGIVCYLKPGPDFEFIRLSDGTTDISSSYTIQSQDISYVESNYKGYVGETFQDIRKMIERPAYYTTHMSYDVSGTSGVMYSTECRYPVLPGPSLIGPWQSTNTSTFVPIRSPPANVNTYNLNRNTLMAQLIPQFVGVSGSVIYIVETTDCALLSTSLGTVFDTYAPFLVPTGSYKQYNATGPVYASYNKSTPTLANYNRTRHNNFRGAQWVIPTVNPVGKIKLPYLSELKYFRGDNTASWDGVRFMMTGVNSSTPNINIWVSAGEDFSLVQFSGVLPLGKIDFSSLDSSTPRWNGLTRAET